MLIIVNGLPGTGKTTFADALAKKLQARHYNTDRIRKKMNLMGSYDETVKQSVYDEMQSLTRTALDKRENVVVDGTFYKEELRETYSRLSGSAGVEAMWIEIKASEETIRERMKVGRPESEADFEVYQKIKKMWEPFNRAHLVLWSDELTLEEMLNKTMDYLKLAA